LVLTTEFPHQERPPPSPSKRIIILFERRCYKEHFAVPQDRQDR
jgi:hypothetical protein